jgi:hypothetical protein
MKDRARRVPKNRRPRVLGTAAADLADEYDGSGESGTI